MDHWWVLKRLHELDSLRHYMNHKSRTDKYVNDIFGLFSGYIDDMERLLKEIHSLITSKQYSGCVSILPNLPVMSYTKSAQLLRDITDQAAVVGAGANDKTNLDALRVLLNSYKPTEQNTFTDYFTRDKYTVLNFIRELSDGINDVKRKYKMNGTVKDIDTTRTEKWLMIWINDVKEALKLTREQMLKCAGEKLRTFGKRRGGFLDFSERGKISEMLYRKAERDLAQGLINHHRV